MDTRYLQSKVSKSLSSSDVHIQSSVLTNVISEVAKYVQQIREDGEVIKEIANYERQARQLRRDKDNQEAQDELAEVSQLLSDAKEVKRNMERKKQTIRRLQNDVDALNRALRSI